MCVLSFMFDRSLLFARFRAHQAGNVGCVQASLEESVNQLPDTKLLDNELNGL
jgi:hypothetical protein